MHRADTATLSARINLKYNTADTTGKWLAAGTAIIHPGDTAAMLGNYDKTANVVSGLALKVNYTDTAAMLANYDRTATVNVLLAAKVNYTDTATMLANYDRAGQKVKYSDTTAMLANYDKTANVVAGLALKVNYTDTAAMLANYDRTATVNVLLAAKVNYTDTAGMLANYDRAGQKVKCSDTAAMLGPYLQLDKVQTETNKRINPRVGSTTSSATPTINTDNYDIYKLTALAVDITSMTTNLSGTPVDGQLLELLVTGTATRNITWGPSFESSTITLPAATVSTAMLGVLLQYNGVTSKWRCTGTW